MKLSQEPVAVFDSSDPVVENVFYVKSLGRPFGVPNVTFPTAPSVLVMWMSGACIALLGLSLMEKCMMKRKMWMMMVFKSV